MKCLLFSLNLHKCFIYCNRQHFVHRQIIPLARNHKKIENKIMLNESGENKRLGASSLMRHLCQPPQYQQNAHTAKSQKRSLRKKLKELKKKMRRSTVREVLSSRHGTVNHTHERTGTTGFYTRLGSQPKP